MENWKLNRVEKKDCTLDDSGIYVVINRIVKKASHKEYSGYSLEIRVDIMSSGDEPLQSFIGDGNDVRKAVMAWINTITLQKAGQGLAGVFTSEHASYIGYEISRAMLTEEYKQD